MRLPLLLLLQMPSFHSSSLDDDARILRGTFRNIRNSRSAKNTNEVSCAFLKLSRLELLKSGGF